MNFTKSCTKCHRCLSVELFKMISNKAGAKNPYRDSQCVDCKRAYYRDRRAGRLPARAVRRVVWARDRHEVECDMALRVFMTATAEPVRASL